MTTHFFFSDPAVMPNSDHGRLENWFLKFSDDAWRETATFIYEMPVVIIATAIAGVASLILFPMFTVPCFGTVAGTVLSRIVVKLVDKQDISLLVKVKGEAIEFNKSYPNITTIVFIFAAIAGLFFSTAGLLIATGLGIFKGIIIQVDIYDYNRNLRRKQIGN